MIRRIAAVLLLMGVSGSVMATQRFLVPIHLLEPVNGAFGSRWVSELTVLNVGPETASIQNYGACPPTGGPCVVPLAPGVSETGGPIRGVVFGYGIPAAMLIVEDRYVDQLVFQSRVRDISRSAESWGAWIPVVPESAAVRGPVALLDVPVHPGYRQTLRVYSFDIAADRSVRVRVYGAVPADPQNPASYEQPNPLLAEVTLPLRYGAGSEALPLYAEIGNLATVPGLSGHDKVWLTIEPHGSFGVWGMVSVTNNTTQEITMIVPHRAR
jgi:hypothetical protein